MTTPFFLPGQLSITDRPVRGHNSAKPCKSCGESKPLADFPRNHTMRDGRLNECKPCFAARLRNSRRDNNRQAESNQAWRERNPEKVRAHVVVSSAVASGRLVRADVCEDCGGEGEPFVDGRSPIQAHHEDYSKPLAVDWLCAACHKARHVHRHREDVAA